MSSINSAQSTVSSTQLQNLDKWAEWQEQEAGKVDGSDAGTVDAGDQYVMQELNDGCMSAAQARQLLLENSGAMRQDSNGALPINPAGSNPNSQANQLRDQGAGYAEANGGESELNQLDGYGSGQSTQNVDKWAEWQEQEAGKVDGSNAGTIDAGDQYIMTQYADGDLSASEADQLLDLNGGAMREDSNGALPINPQGSDPNSQANMLRDLGADFASFDNGQSPLDLLDGYQQQWWGA